MFLTKLYLNAPFFLVFLSFLLLGILWCQFKKKFPVSPPS